MNGTRSAGPDPGGEMIELPGIGKITKNSMTAIARILMPMAMTVWKRWSRRQPDRALLRQCVEVTVHGKRANPLR
jgi:hypothetical protein